MSMAGYTKLFNSILASTIWRADDKTRIVWITLLAMADKDGVAEGSVPGLADLARVSIEDCEAALAELMAPDKYSRTTEFEGRRIEPVDGGWLLLNHAKYRAKMSEDDIRERNRQRQARWRERQKNNATSNTTSQNVTDSNTKSRQSRHTEAEAYTKAEEEEEEEEEAAYAAHTFDSSIDLMPAFEIDEPTQTPLAMAALGTYEATFKPHRLSLHQQALIADRVTDLTAWQKTLDFWKGNSYRPQSIAKMLDYYDEEVAGKHNGNTKGSNFTNKPTPGEVIANRDYR